MLLIVGAIACVLASAVGQVLFKAGAISINEAGTFVAVRPLTLLALAFALYFLASIGWVLLLKRAALGQIYPVMALSFIIVPVASFFVFGEEFGRTYILGISLIAAGIILCVRA